MRESIRPGGRSARVQAAVHAAVRDLTADLGRDALTVPLIAERAGVTPSTIYRRWGALAEVLADVALEEMRPDAPPLDTGSLSGDLQAWAEQYLEELSSRPGRAMIKDAIAAASDSSANRCASILAEQLRVIHDRAQNRGDQPPPVERMIDVVVAPIVFHVLFDDQELNKNYCETLVRQLLS